MTDSVFNAYSRYYDLLYADKDYAGEAAYVHGLLVRHGVHAGAELLEFGSGTGRHARLLAARSHTVHGIERSAEMVARAQQGQGFSCQQGDIRSVDLGRRFDAVLSLFHVVSYQVDNNAVSAVFDCAAAHLAGGGLFVFDFWYSPAVYAQRPSVRVKRMQGEGLEVTRIAEPVCYPNQNRVDVQYTIFARDVATGVVETLQETHPMRHLSLPEVDLLARLHGFERVAAEEFLSGRPPGEDTWGVCVVLKRIDHE